MADTNNCTYMAVYAVLTAMLVWSDGFQPYRIPYCCKLTESLDGTGTVSVKRYRVLVDIRHGAQHPLSPTPFMGEY